MQKSPFANTSPTKLAISKYTLDLLFLKGGDFGDEEEHIALAIVHPFPKYLKDKLISEDSKHTLPGGLDFHIGSKYFSDYINSRLPTNYQLPELEKEFSFLIPRHKTKPNEYVNSGGVTNTIDPILEKTSFLLQEKEIELTVGCLMK